MVGGGEGERSVQGSVGRGRMNFGRKGEESERVEENEKKEA